MRNAAFVFFRKQSERVFKRLFQIVFINISYDNKRVERRVQKLRISGKNVRVLRVLKNVILRIERGAVRLILIQKADCTVIQLVYRARIVKAFLRLHGVNVTIRLCRCNFPENERIRNAFQAYCRVLFCTFYGNCAVRSKSFA